MVYTSMDRTDTVYRVAPHVRDRPALVCLLFAGLARALLHSILPISFALSKWKRRARVLHVPVVEEARRDFAEAHSRHMRAQLGSRRILQ